jgi:NAD(P)H-dependent FMN reductase
MELPKLNILAISGSTRRSSSNLYLIKAIEALTRQTLSIKLFDGLANLPHFNPDLDDECVPEEVTHFRKQIAAAEGVLICTPEYAMGVPGTLKNAIDWTVSSMEFSKKPVALITASLSGEKSHRSLLETLRVIEADVRDETQLVISFIKTKVNDQNKITDETTMWSVENLMKAFESIIRNKTTAD